MGFLDNTAWAYLRRNYPSLFVCHGRVEQAKSAYGQHLAHHFSMLLLLQHRCALPLRIKQCEQ